MKSFWLKILGLVFLGAALSGGAGAEEAAGRVEAGHAAVAKKAPEYVPIVVDRAQFDAVMGHLNGMAFKDALPLVKWLSDLEDRAKRQWEADNNKPAEPAK